MATKINEEDPESPELTDQGKPRGKESDPAYQEIESEFVRAQEVGRNQARLDRINQIARNADRVRASRDNGAEPEMSLEDMESTDEDETSEETEKPLAEQATEEPEEEIEQPAPTAKKFRIRVDGTDIELSEQELIARASKVSAADKYLEDAKRAKDEASRAAPSQQDVRPPVPSPDEEDSALVRAIQVGTEDEAKGALRKLRQQLSVNPDVVVKVVEERLNFKDAVDYFKSEFKDIEASEELRNRFFYFDTLQVKTGDQRPYKERYKEIGQWVRGISGRTASQQSREEKVNRKASSAPVPRSANARNAAPEPEDRDETPSEIIAGMAKARGQFVRG